MGSGQCQHRQNEDLRVPKCVTIVASTRQSFGGNGSVFRTISRLQNMEEGKAHRLLNLRVAFQFNGCTRPEIVQVSPLLGKQAIPTSQLRGSQRSYDLIVNGWSRAQTRPAIRDKFYDPQPLTRLQPPGDGHSHDIGRACRLNKQIRWPLDSMVHRRTHEQATDTGAMNEQTGSTMSDMLLALERGCERGTHAGIL